MRRLVAVLLLIVASLVGWGAGSVTVAAPIAITDELGIVELAVLSPPLTTVEPADVGDPSLAAASYESNAAEVIVYAYDTPAVSRVKAGRTRTAEQALPLDETGEMLTAGGSASIGRASMTPVVSLVTPRVTHSIDDLSRAAGAVDRNGLTAAGRAAQKHGNRPGSSFPLSPDRTASGYNQFGQNLVDDLLAAPNTATQRWVHPQFGQVTDFWGPNYGVRFGPNGEFIGFLDP